MRLMLVLIGLVALQSRPDVGSGNWPHWRGPSHDGVSRETGLPVSWGAKCADAPRRRVSRERAGSRHQNPLPRRRKAEAAAGAAAAGKGGRSSSVSCAKIETTNVAWKLPLPAYSGSTPIIWGDRSS